MSKTKDLIGTTVNRISARDCIGIYKTQMIGIEIGNTLKTTKVYFDGKLCKDRITGIWIKILPNKKTKLTMELIQK